MKVSKTKLAGLGFILFNVVGAVIGQIPYNDAIQGVLTGVAIIGGRDALAKLSNK